MTALFRLVFLVALMVLGAPSCIWCQTSAPLPGPTEATSSVPFQELWPPAEAGGEAGWQQPVDAPAAAEPPTESPGFLQHARVDVTWLAGGAGRSLQITDVESSTTLGVPLVEGWAPLLLTPNAAVHLWQGPKGNAAVGTPDLPSSLYDLYVEIGWRPRLARWLFADLAVTPGVYSDFKDVSAQSFLMRGRGLAIVAFSPQWQLVLGALYVNRNKTRFLPAGGVIWSPSEDTRFALVFPQPKISHRLTTIGRTPLWAYLAGEFGGGRWIVARASGATDSIDYTDLRVDLGLESTLVRGWKGHLEVGYVFGRRVNFTSDTPDVKLPDTVMLRAGLCY
jgi:hypothetical protein